MEVESETDGTFTFDENQSKNEIITKNEFVENSSAAEEKRKFFAGILVDVYQDIYLLQSKSKFLNDVELQCKDGEFLYVPSVLLVCMVIFFFIIIIILFMVFYCNCVQFAGGNFTVVSFSGASSRFDRKLFLSLTRCGKEGF